MLRTRIKEQTQTAEVRELFNQSLCKMKHQVRTVKHSTSTYFKQVTLNNVDIILDEGTGFRKATRTPHDIAQHPSDDFLIAIPLSAQVSFSQAGKKSHFGLGSFTILSTANPFSAAISPLQQQTHFKHNIVRVRGPLLRQRVAYIDELCAHQLQIEVGVGNIMRSIIELALEEGRALSDTQAQRFSMTIIDAISEAIISAARSNFGKIHTRQSSKYQLLEKAKLFIFANLTDPKLNASKIAEHCHVSVRYLRSAFALSPQTMSRFIRETRLQKCHETISNPQMTHRSILDISLFWGFNDSAYFSRSYRNHFGQTPSCTRKTALQTKGTNLLSHQKNR